MQYACVFDVDGGYRFARIAYEVYRGPYGRALVVEYFDMPENLDEEDIDPTMIDCVPVSENPGIIYVDSFEALCRLAPKAPIIARLNWGKNAS